MMLIANARARGLGRILLVAIGALALLLDGGYSAAVEPSVSNETSRQKVRAESTAPAGSVRVPRIANPSAERTTTGEADVQESCYYITNTAYAYVNRHRPQNRRAHIRLRIDFCETVDEFGLEYITRAWCSSTVKRYRGAVRSHGKRYSTMNTNYQRTYKRGLRCQLTFDGWNLFAQVGQDWRINRSKRPRQVYACPGAFLDYWAGDPSALGSRCHDRFQAAGGIAGDTLWRCPVWR